MKPTNNHVKIRLVGDIIQTMTQTKGGLRLHINPHFEPEKHSATQGVVVAVPDRLKFNKDHNLLRWKTEMEIQEGDEVLIDWDAAFRAREMGMYEKKGDDIYIIVKYHDIFLARRNGKTIPLNGLVFVEMVANDDLPEELLTKEQIRMKNSSIVIPGGKKKSVRYCRVVLCGEPVQDKCKIDRAKDYLDVKLNPGDIVVVKNHAMIPMEYYMHKTFMPEKEVYKVYSDTIIATYQKQD